MSEIAPATVGVSANRGIVLLPLLRGGPALLCQLSLISGLCAFELSLPLNVLAMSFSEHLSIVFKQFQLHMLEVWQLKR